MEVGRVSKAFGNDIRDVAGVTEVGFDDDEYGQRLKAFVVVADGKQLSEDEAKKHVKSNLSGYKVPRAVLVGEAPRTNVGKPDYVRAAELARARLGL